jgi:hypothetical protein
VNMDYISPHEQFETVVIKWWKVANNVNAISHSFFWRNNATCKDKWCSVYGGYNKIFFTCLGLDMQLNIGTPWHKKRLFLIY